MMSEPTKEEVELLGKKAGKVISCRFCGKKFYIKPCYFKTAQYCSKDCSNRGRRIGEVRECKICGKTFYAPRSQIKIGRGKFCSLKCTGRYNAGRKPGQYKYCLSCSKRFYVSPCRRISAKFCSCKCMGEHQKGKPLSDKAKKKLRTFNLGRLKGDKNPHWKGGITPLRAHIRQLDQYKRWRSNVYQRDNWTCQTCGTRSRIGVCVHLEAHHIKSFGKIIEEHHIKSLDDARSCKELWKIDNGVTLCVECHNLTKKGRKK